MSRERDTSSVRTEASVVEHPKSADAILREIMRALPKLVDPPPRAIYVHPDDYDAIIEHPAIVATSPSRVPHAMIDVRGVAVYTSRAVDRGTFWIDPPQRKRNQRT